ncbi:MAG TPA: cyanophycin synthetase [Gallionellaceae bacterium]|nr:cyanophycin synthetase [Gallionellaceae bacterium]
MKKNDLKFIKVMSLRGPNIWTYRPVLEAWVDIGDLEDAPSNTIPGFYERLSAWLPGLIEHRCGVGERGGFLQRLREGTWPGHILEHVTLELQNLAGMQTGFGKARETSVRGLYKVAVRTRHEKVGRACMEAARELVLAAIEDSPYDLAGTLTRLKDLADSLCLGPSTACIVDAATERGIPSMRLTDGNLVQLGYGVNQHRIWTAETDKTSAIAESISSDKDLTKQLLQSCGVPIPEGRLVDSPADAWEAAEDIGVPVVVKPLDANHGRGVSAELMTKEEIEAAYQVAIQEGSSVIVERFIRGHEHRILVIAGKVVAAARGESAFVIGDGSSTIRALIDTQLNTDPRRGVTEDFPLSLIILEEEPAILLELSRQGFEPDSIPAAGKKVMVQRNGNMAFDVTDQVHPDVALVTTLAAKVVGLDIAGIDLVAEDISRPLEEQRGAIVEVNAGPGLLMHLKPAQGEARPVGEAIVNSLFPNEDNGRIPIVGISGSQGKTLVAQLLARLLHLGGKQVGMSCSKGLYLNHRQLQPGNCANWEAGHKILLNRAVEAAVLVNGAREILAEGLPYDRCLIGVVTNLAHHADLDNFYVHTPEHLYNVLRTQVDVVLPEGMAILNADDVQVAGMASLCDGEVIFFGSNPDNEVMLKHLKQNGRAVVLRDRHVMLAQGKAMTPLSTLEDIQMANGCTSPVVIDSLLAAIACAWALNLPTELIRTGVETFRGE